MTIIMLLKSPAFAGAAVQFACTVIVDTAGCGFSRRSGGLLPSGAYPLSVGRS